MTETVVTQDIDGRHVVFSQEQAKELARKWMPLRPKLDKVRSGGSGVELDLSTGQQVHLCYSDELGRVILHLVSLDAERSLPLLGGEGVEVFVNGKKVSK